MKKLILLTIMAIAIQTQAQNVGIGTPTPGAKLEVVGTGNTSTSNTFLLKNSSATSLLRMQDNGQLFVGQPIVADIRQYKFRVESGDRGSLFIENPVTTANQTVRILRGVPESAGGFTTALWVEASGDRAAIFKGRGGIEVESTFNLIPAGAFTAAPTGQALYTDGNLQFRGIGEAPGKVLISDATGNAAWKNSTKYTSITPPSCQLLATATDTYAKIADLGSFTKDNLDTKIELMFQTHLRIASISGVQGATYELRIDNIATTNGNARASIQVIAQGENTSIFGLFTGLPIGAHTVSIWARSGAEGNIGGTATNVMYDHGCWSASNLTVKETF